MAGFFTASEAIFGRAPSEVTEDKFLTLVAVLIAPGSFDLRGYDPAFIVRVARIRRLLAGECVPSDHHDVWLDGCS